MTAKTSNKKLKRTGLFFGSFNPVHLGHLIIAQYFINHTDLEQIWFVVSPHNPLKKKHTLAPDHHRLNMLKVAIDDNPHFRVSDIEFYMPQPSYTIHTLTYLKEKYPRKEFVLIMGGDNLETFTKWKNHEQIIAAHQIYVYNRPNCQEKLFIKHAHISYFEAPQMNISSSQIRESIKAKKDIRYLVCDTVKTYIDDTGIYG